MSDIKKYNLVNDIGFIKTGVNRFNHSKKYYSTKSIQDKTYIPEGEYNYVNRPSRANREVKEGDVLQARMMSTNKAILIDKKIDGSLFSTGFFQFRPPKKLIEPKFLYYYLSSNFFLEKKDMLCSGSTQKAINDSNLKKIEIKIPNLSKQKLIVNKLDATFAHLNNLNSRYLKFNNEVDLFFEKFKSRLFENLIDFNENTLKEICEKITDGTHQTPKYFDKGYIFLSSKNVKTKKIDWQKIKYIDESQHKEMQKRVSPQMGDILLAKNGTTGMAAIVDKNIPFDIYVSLALLRCKENVIPEYLLEFINSNSAYEQFSKRTKGIGVQNLHLQEIREVLIKYPKSKIEQKNVVDKIDFIKIIREKLNIIYEKKKNNLISLKEKILKKELNNLI